MCIPDCASGTNEVSQVSISLSDPGDYLGYQVFQNIIVTPADGGPAVEAQSGEMGSGWGSNEP
jgi:hypothetical protein